VPYREAPRLEHPLATLRALRPDDIGPWAEIAYDLAPEGWGRGLASAAVRALVTWAFAEAGLLRRYRLVRGVPGDFWMFSRLA
jgi:RimJ/RimL family protein N-acetyltransferase